MPVRVVGYVVVGGVDGGHGSVDGFVDVWDIRGSDAYGDVGVGVVGCVVVVDGGVFVSCAGDDWFFAGYIVDIPVEGLLFAVYESGVERVSVDIRVEAVGGDACDNRVAVAVFA